MPLYVITLGRFMTDNMKQNEANDNIKQMKT